MAVVRVIVGCWCVRLQTNRQQFHGISLCSLMVLRILTHATHTFHAPGTSETRHHWGLDWGLDSPLGWLKTCFAEMRLAAHLATLPVSTSRPGRPGVDAHACCSCALCRGEGSSVCSAPLLSAKAPATLRSCCLFSHYDVDRGASLGARRRP